MPIINRNLLSLLYRQMIPQHHLPTPLLRRLKYQLIKMLTQPCRKNLTIVQPSTHHTPLLFLILPPSILNILRGAPRNLRIRNTGVIQPTRHPPNNCPTQKLNPKPIPPNDTPLATPLPLSIRQVIKCKLFVEG